MQTGNEDANVKALRALQQTGSLLRSNAIGQNHLTPSGGQQGDTDKYQVTL